MVEAYRKHKLNPSENLFALVGMIESAERLEDPAQKAILKRRAMGMAFEILQTPKAQRGELVRAFHLLSSQNPEMAQNALTALRVFNMREIDLNSFLKI